MRFTRHHTRNGIHYKPGDPYAGPVHSGRFLYHRGIIEPDGGPDDAAITAKHTRRQAWDVDVPEPPKKRKRRGSAPDVITWSTGEETE